jgi:DNA-binding LytR/AlgR family response regulator
MLNCLIVDDEPLAHKVIERYIQQIDTLSLMGNAYKAIDAMNFLQKNAVDIVFLDIQMPEMTGLEFLKTLQQPPNVILTTAYSEYALESYELGVIDYLLKPIRFDRFLKAVQRVSIPKKMITENDYFFVKVNGVQHRINVADICFVEACGNFVKIHFTDKFLLTAETMIEMENKLNVFNFMRVHKSFIINIDKIDRLDGNVIYTDKSTIPIGASYKNFILKKLSII